MTASSAPVRSKDTILLTRTRASAYDLRPMTPSRRELMQSLAELILVTQDLAHATRENIRMTQRLREEIARLGRRPRTRRLTRVGPAGGAPGARPTAATVSAIRLPAPK